MKPATRTVRRLASRLAAWGAAVALALATGACAADPSPDATASSDPTAATSAAAGTGTVAVFTPSDGITLSQSTPVNKWAALAKDLQQAIKEQTNDATHVTVTSSGDLASQSQAVQDYVVSQLGGKQTASSDVTLVVAPVSNPDAVTRQYGDYVRQDVTWNDASDANDASGANANDAADDASPDASGDASPSASGSASSDASSSSAQESDADRTRRESGQRLVAALQLASQAGMHVVLVSNALQGFTPDAFVQFSTPELIGRIQAQQLVRKLELDRTSKNNPKHIEVLLPYAPTRKDGTPADSSFAEQAFRGIWDVLGPYFADGRAVSPSQYLSAATTADDWRAVAYDPTASDATKNELTERLGMTDSSTHRRINGILAMNDYVAGQTVSTLTALGYSGSAADINPEITISGIVGSFAGKVDLQKGKVPDPSKAPTASPSADDDQIKLPFIGSGDSADDAAWPIVTGYGAYADTLPQIVNGKQWMTALGNRKDTAALLAKAVIAMNAGEDATQIEGMQTTDYGGAQVPLIAKDQLAVSASNLKSMLIDTGYVTPADAGL